MPLAVRCFNDGHQETPLGFLQMPVCGVYMVKVGLLFSRYPDNDEAAINGVHDSAASPRAANSVPRSPTGNGRIPICESGSLQKSFVSNSSLHSESAHSLVNNESLGLDERNIFENFSKMAASRRR